MIYDQSRSAKIAFKDFLFLYYVQVIWGTTMQVNEDDTGGRKFVIKRLLPVDQCRKIFSNRANIQHRQSQGYSVH